MYARTVSFAVASFVISFGFFAFFAFDDAADADAADEVVADGGVLRLFGAVFFEPAVEGFDLLEEPPPFLLAELDSPPSSS